MIVTNFGEIIACIRNVVFQCYLQQFSEEEVNHIGFCVKNSNFLLALWMLKTHETVHVETGQYYNMMA